MSHSRPCSSAEPSLHSNVNKTSDVFLSFRGPDTREGFVRRLYNALVGRGISTFLNEESLEKGDHFPTCLERGIKESRICIPIFSQKFPESKWCLKEVSLMVKYRVECEIKICPLFYDVLPTVLRCREENGYAEYFKQHESQQSLSADLILEYKSALKTVSYLCGWCFDQYESDDYLIKGVVDDVRKSLHSMSLKKVYMDIPQCFGLEGSVKYLKRLISPAVHQKEVVKVGIHGMGGIGKTTLAKIVCKELPFSQFEAFSFVPSVEERCRETNGLAKLQTQMLKGVSQFRGEVDYVDQGKGLLQDCLRGKKVLLFLDDIESSDQLEALAGNHRDFGVGSCVIITSRDEQILKVGNVDVVYEVRRLPHRSAMELFNFHAFPNSYCPDQELRTLSNDIVGACEGLPLALQTFGKLLVGERDRDVWKEMVGKLRCEANIQKKLRVSYDRLDPSEKEMFQDIACFFAWSKKEIVMIFWAGLIPSPGASLRNLLQKSLVSLGPSKEFLMHCCLQDLGRSISNEMSREPRKRTRLFDEGDAYHILRRPSEKARHVRYFGYEPKEPMTLKAEMFKSLYNVQLLWLTDIAIQGHFSEEFSFVDLRWLSLRNYSSKRLPQGMNLQNLVILEVTHSQIIHLWDETAQENLNMRPGNLKILILRGCESLKSLPATLGYTPLQTLDLHNCHSLSSLPNTMESWNGLVNLDMEGCSVSSLPQDFGELANLRELNLSRCANLSKLPDSFGNLTQLERLEIHHNHKLTELPKSFGGLKSLAYLDVSYCYSLSSLPNTVGSLISLVCLQMEGCGVSSLPQNLCNLANLQELNLSYCQHLSELPASFGNLSQLVIMEIHHIAGLTELPKSLGSLQQLTTLNLVGCNSISCGSLESCLSGLPVLESVSVGGPGFSSPQLQVFYDSFKDFSFSKTRLLDNPDAPANWVYGKGDGKNGCGKKCIDYSTDENKVEFCAGYTVCLVCSGQKVNSCISRLSYKIERDDSLLKCSVNSQNTTIGVGDYFEVRLVRVESNLDFAWLKTGNKVRVNATSDYENWKASFKFLMYETTLRSEEHKAPEIITFFM